MLFRTHLLFGFVLVLFFLPYIAAPLVFIPLVLIASLLPDIDSMHSYLGRSIWFRPLQFVMKHRGMLHSLSFCVGVSILLLLALPVTALPFFVGYGGHLLLDACTIEGIHLWWPRSQEIHGSVTTGSTMETGFFYGLILVCICLFIVRFF